MANISRVVRAARVITSDGEVPAAIGISAGRIIMVEDIEATIPAEVDIRLGDDIVVLPGLVDTHVHLQDPGRTEWENFESGTRAAAAGGITTLVDMPLDCLPVTVTVPALEAKRQAAAGRCHVDVGFWAGVTPHNIHLLRDLHDAGALGFKCFLTDTGMEEFPPLNSTETANVIAELGLIGATLLVHAEDPYTFHPTPSSATDYHAYLTGCPPETETKAVERVIDIASRTEHARLHIVHVSSADSAAMIDRARSRGIAISAKTCPHYLTFSADDIPDGATAFKVCPPIRDAENRTRLWGCLRRGALDMVVSDHSPFPTADKRDEGGDFVSAPGGISSLQVSLAATWTAARQRQVSLPEIAYWMSTRPAQLAGLPTKGLIAPGRDADLCFLAPDETFTVDPAKLAHLLPGTPYAGRTLYGVVRRTWLRGQPVDFRHPRGALLKRSAQNRLRR
ncbi:allantoinase AllB [Streptomyces sp. NPDC094448]|uniref:allantoinase AllB n=1 Tax=Streptomyces sp. NPDC094448 TaxID=3366063 RepID=UPI0037F5FD71